MSNKIHSIETQILIKPNFSKKKLLVMALNKDEFRDYLDSCGILDSLTTVFVRLYKETTKPVNAIAYLVRHLSELDPDAELERCYGQMLSSTQCNSLLKKYLTKQLVDELKIKITSLKSKLMDCIRSGLENPESGIGIYASDPECYEVFSKIFKPIIEDYHYGFVCTNPHPDLDWGALDVFPDLDPDGKYIISTRIRCGRSIDGYPFHQRLTESQYIEIMEQVQAAVETLEGDNAGTFHILSEMSVEEKQALIEGHYLFKEDDRFLKSAGAHKFWPKGRAIFLNESKTFLVWVNEEDHIRIISMQPGGDVGMVYARLKTCVESLSGKIQFARSPTYGYLTFCPSNLGTTIRASVHIRLPNLSKDVQKLNDTAAELYLQVRGTHGEHTTSEEGIFDISNKRRLGLTEFNAIKEMYDGIRKLIQMDQDIENGLGENGGGAAEVKTEVEEPHEEDGKESET